MPDFLSAASKDMHASVTRMSNELLFVSGDLYWPICEKMVLEADSICIFKLSVVQIEEEKAVVNR